MRVDVDIFVLPLWFLELMTSGPGTRTELLVCPFHMNAVAFPP